MCSLSGSLFVDVMSFMGRRIILDVARVVLRIASLEGREEGAQQGGIDPYHAREDGAPWDLTNDEVLQLHVEGLRRALNPQGQI